MTSVVIVGSGRMGLSLASALAGSGAYREIAVFGRHAEAPEHPVFGLPEVRYVFGLEPLAAHVSVLLLAVPDAAVPEVAYHVAELGAAPEGCAAFHLSGALPTDVLEPLYHRGYGVGSFHPLVVLADPERAASRFAGAFAAVTAAPGPFRTALALGDALRMEVFAIPAARRPLYHAATALVESAVVPVVAHAARLLERAGVDAGDALPALISLARGSLTSLEEGGVPGAAHGVARLTDAETVSVHLRALDEDERRLYAVLARELLRLADVDPGQAGSELPALYGELETTGAGS